MIPEKSSFDVWVFVREKLKMSALPYIILAYALLIAILGWSQW